MATTPRQSVLTSTHATIAGLSALVVLAMVLQTSAPAVVGSGQATSPVPRATQPKHEAERQEIAEKPSADTAEAVVAPRAGFFGMAMLSPRAIDAVIRSPREAAKQGLGDTAPPVLG